MADVRKLYGKLIQEVRGRPESTDPEERRLAEIIRRRARDDYRR